MYLIRYVVEVDWVPDGAGPLSMPSAQKLKLGSLEFAGLTVANPTISITGQPTGYQQVPGGDAPTQGNFNTALTGSSATPAGGLALDISTAVAANLARIQGFASGTG